MCNRQSITHCYLHYQTKLIKRFSKSDSSRFSTSPTHLVPASPGTVQYSSTQMWAESPCSRQESSRKWIYDLKPVVDLWPPWRRWRRKREGFIFISASAASCWLARTRSSRSAAGGFNIPPALQTVAVSPSLPAKHGLLCWCRKTEGNDWNPQRLIGKGNSRSREATTWMLKRKKESTSRDEIL